MEIYLLSFSDILSENLNSLRISASNRGHRILEIEPTRLSLLVSNSKTEVHLDGENFEPKVVLHRTIAKFMGVCLPILQTLQSQGSFIVNDPKKALDSRSKLESALAFQKANLPFLPSQFFHSGMWHEFDIAEPLILKPINGVQGRGIEFFDNRNEASRWVADRARDTSPYWIDGFLMQQDLGKEVRDIRAFVVNGVCRAIMERIPGKDSRLANLAQGGHGIALERKGTAVDLAESAVKALGLDFAGVDILETKHDIYVSEVDAWAGFAGIESVTGVSIGDAIIDLIEEKQL